MYRHVYRVGCCSSGSGNTACAFACRRAVLTSCMLVSTARVHASAVCCTRRALHTPRPVLSCRVRAVCVVTLRRMSTEANNTTEYTMTRRDDEHDADDDDSDGGGFREDAIVAVDELGNAVTRIRKLPLSLIEEVPPPVHVPTDIELVMMAWCEEHARRVAALQRFLYVAIALLVMIVLYLFYKTQIACERTIRGVRNMPPNLRIGSVVYFDVSENGVDIGRIVIGLLTEQCPLYCEYFHRRCTGSGGNGESFRGMRLSALLPRHCLIFGDGRDMRVDVPGFHAQYLPTEHHSDGAWRGALSSIARGVNQESGNFILHVSAGDYKPQVFGMVIGGYNVVERINQAGSRYGNAPKNEYVIEACGELCTLAKTHIVPMPWKLYEGVSRGYDAERFGPRAPAEWRNDDDDDDAHNTTPAAAAAPVAVRTHTPKLRRRWLPF